MKNKGNKQGDRNVHIGLFLFWFVGHVPGLCQAVNYYRGSENLLCKKVPLVK